MRIEKTTIPLGFSPELGSRHVDLLSAKIFTVILFHPGIVLLLRGKLICAFYRCVYLHTLIFIDYQGMKIIILHHFLPFLYCLKPSPLISTNSYQFSAF